MRAAVVRFPGFDPAPEARRSTVQCKAQTAFTVWTPAANEKLSVLNPKRPISSASLGNSGNRHDADEVAETFNRTWPTPVARVNLGPWLRLADPQSEVVVCLTVAGVPE